MRRLTALSFLLPAVLVGCGETAPSVAGPDVALRASRSAAEVALPFRTTSYSFHGTGPAPEQDCTNAGEVRQQTVGEGTATHLGRYTVVLSFCGRKMQLTEGRGAFTAANGDLLDFTFHGASRFPSATTLEFTSFVTFTGGTGRFTDATGEAVVTGMVDLTTGLSDGSWDGTISYKR